MLGTTTHPAESSTTGSRRSVCVRACGCACGCEVVRIQVCDMFQVFFEISVTCTEMVDPIPTFPGCPYQSGNWSQKR